MTAITPILAELTWQRDGIPPGQHEALVTGPTPEGVMLHIQGVPVAALVAASCLILPEPGDRVLAAAAEKIWVIAVLRRAAATPPRLQAGPDLVIGAPDGTVTIEGSSLTMRARSATVLIDELLHVGQSVTAHLAGLKTVAGLIESFAQRVMLTARRSQRVVEETDELRAGDIDHQAARALHLQADCAFITGGTAIRMDAGQIHMG
jgi:hypothetical protein